jgi:NADPH-dependent curcumin reductase CurA
MLSENQKSEEITMKNIMSREIRLASRPNGLPTAANFELTQTEMAPLKNG